jgi:uncharacterized protein YyaL (SSP411 family)
MIVRTLDAMRIGGIYDPIEGGFFRYSTTRDWSIPHYEKMLEDNSGLMSIYIQAYSASGDNKYLDIAKSIMHYLENVLLDEHTGTFSGSQNADEEYYQLPKEAREERNPPSVDQTIYVNWNSIAIDAYLKAYEATSDRSYLDRALRALNFIVNLCRNDSFCHYYTDGPHEYGLLTDQMWAGTALLRAYECTGDRRYIQLAKETADSILNDFADSHGGFFDVTEERMRAKNLLYREKLVDENSYVARFLNRLSYYTHESVYRRSAEAALRVLTGAYESYGILAAPYGLAVTEFLEEPVKVAIAGSSSDRRTEELLNSTLRSKGPSSVVQMLGQDASEEELREFGMQSADEPLASVCIRQTCRSTSDPDELQSAIREAERG